MFEHRQQLDVGEAEVLHVRHQPIRHLAVGQEAVPFLGYARPRREVHLVDRHRPIEPALERAPVLHPPVVGPRLPLRLVDDRCRERRHLEPRAVRVLLLHHLAGGGAHLVLVALARRHPRDEDRPDTVRHQQPHRVGASVPPVEVADDADTRRVRSPDGEVHPGGRADPHHVRAKVLPGVMILAPGKQIERRRVDERAVAIGIVDLAFDAVAGADPKPVVQKHRLRVGLDGRFEHSRRVHPRHRRGAEPRTQEVHAGGVRLQRAHHERAGPIGQMRSEDRERIAVGGVDQGIKDGVHARISCWNRHSLPGRLSDLPYNSPSLL